MIRFMQAGSAFPQEALATVALDRESLPQSSLNIERRVRTNPFPWAGQFSPQLVEELLAAYASSGTVVLDPFAGCGTTLVEAARMGLTACGSELNPAAMILARAYQMINLDEVPALRRSMVSAPDFRKSSARPPDHRPENLRTAPGSKPDLSGCGATPLPESHGIWPRHWWCFATFTASTWMPISF